MTYRNRELFEVGGTWYVLCIMYCVLCTMYYVLCIVYGVYYCVPQKVSGIASFSIIACLGLWFVVEPANCGTLIPTVFIPSLQWSVKLLRV